MFDYLAGNPEAARGGGTPVVPLAVNLAMTDRPLLRGGVVPAHLDGYGVVPAQWARNAVRRQGLTRSGPPKRRPPRCRDDAGPPGTARADRPGQEAPRPASAPPDAQARTGVLPRTPDRRHPDGYAAPPAPPAAASGAGWCGRCNLAKEAPGWSTRPVPGGEFTYPSDRPGPVGPRRTVWERSLERHLPVVA